MRPDFFPRSRQCLGLGALALGCAACRPSLSQPNRPAPLPQDPQIQVFFNQSQSQQYRHGYGAMDGMEAPLRDGDDLEAVIVEAIAQAQSTVEVAVQELRLPRIAQALIERQRAGVEVRVILENQYNQTLAEIDRSRLQGRGLARVESLAMFVDGNGDGAISAQEVQERDAIAQLRAARIPLLDDRADGSKGSGLMHHKFVVVDRRTVVTGSANFTVGGIHQEPTAPESRGNVNHLLRLESPVLASLFQEEFEILWGDGPGGESDSVFGVKKPIRPPRAVALGDSLVTVQFSPTGKRQPWQDSSNGLIAQTVAQATQSIDLAHVCFFGTKNC